MFFKVLWFTLGTPYYIYLYLINRGSTELYDVDEAINSDSHLIDSITVYFFSFSSQKLEIVSRSTGAAGWMYAQFAVLVGVG